ncbi:ABC transporter permease [Zavarzinella formosa]|uniref:ABC transporter permease n=1 Tax=Zavarzinella formosa TaxID=360055 RepID=UPI000304C427|nr:ABC transporter permease [Zavarzinella formosa]
MKPLAILKDSIREAWDSKILLVMIIFAILLLGLIGSFSYIPAPPDEAIRRNIGQFLAVRADHGRAEMPIPPLPIDYTLENFTVLKEASNPAQGEYRFTLKASGYSLSELEDANANANRRPGARNKNAPAKVNKDKEEPKDDLVPKERDPKDDTLVLVAAVWNTDSQDAAALTRVIFKLDDPKKLETIATQMSDRVLEDFIREKIEFHMNMKVAVCARKPGPLTGPQEFEVITAPSDPRSWPHDVQPFFGSFSLKAVIGYNPLGVIVWWIEDKLINGYGAAVAILFGIIVTSFFIPNMLRKGNVDLLLAKPISRTSLLLYKYLGGLSFMLILSAVTVIGAWLIIGVRTGIWNPKFLLVIPALTFSFAIFYALSTMIGVWTRSIIACILLTCFASVALYVIAFGYSIYEHVKKFPGMKDEMPAWLEFTAEASHTVLPRTDDLDRITTKLISETMTQQDQTRNGLHVKTYPSWAGTIGVSLAWIAAMLGLSCWRFTKKDY